VGTANAANNRLTLYFPNLCGTFERIDEQARLAVQHGIRGVVVAPQLIGFDSMRYLSRKYNLMMMAHPSLTGTFFTSKQHGFTPALLLGKLFRLFGADISVFPSWGGRFCFSRRECREIAALLTEKTAVRRAFPAPAGGMRLERVGEIGDIYGEDAVLLVGGALLKHSTDLYRSTMEFMDALRNRFPEELREPLESFGSSCEIQPSKRSSASGSLVSFDNFNWSGRPRTAYKSPEANGFSGISRTELFGGADSGTAFELRYFEITPGGFSSFEKHLHEHVIIGVRGRGILQKGEDSLTIGLNDIARVGPFEPHRLYNESVEPFGFYCIVDRKRDKPVSAD
jgi:ribulose-bisphosphate carboxylase large chain